MKLRAAARWLTVYFGLPLLAFVLMLPYRNAVASVSPYILGFYALILLFLSAGSKSKFGVSSLGYDLVKTLLRIIWPFVWALIGLTLLYALTHPLALCGYIC